MHLSSLFLIFIPAFNFSCGGIPWQWPHTFPHLLHIPLPKVNNHDKYEEWENYVLAYSDNECKGWNHLSPELKTTTSGSCYGGKRYWKKEGCVVSMAVILLLPQTFSPYKGTWWNLSFPRVLTLHSRKENCALSSVLSQFVPDNWWSGPAPPQGLFADWPHICLICGLPLSPHARHQLGSGLPLWQLHCLWPLHGCTKVGKGWAVSCS